MNTGFDRATRALILERDAFRCIRCRSNAGIQIHHRRPRKAGGTRTGWVNRAANGITLCHRCHALIESRRTWAYQHGYLIRMGETDAESVPLETPYGLVALFDDGTTKTITRKETA